MATSQSDWTNTKVNAIYDGGTQAVQYTIVKRVVSATDPSDGKIHVTPVTALTDKPYGVIQENAKTGTACTVVVIGGTLLQVGAAQVNAGADVQCDASGNAIIYTTNASYWNFGVFDTEAAAGAITSAVVNGATPTKGV
jgi:hypothetical protein